MTTVLIVASWLLVALAAFVVVLNYTWAIMSVRNKRRGIDRHVSTVPVIVIVLCIIALGLARGRGAPFPPPVLFAALVLLDPGLWGLLALPFRLLRRGN